MTIDQHADIVGYLHVSTVDVTPRNIDWTDSDEYGETERDYWEAFEYEHDDDTHTLIAAGGSVVAVVIDGHPFTSYRDYADLVEEPVMSGEDFDSLMAAEPYEWGSEGPMMNYWYPIKEDAGGPYGSSFDPIDAAAKLAHLPLCVVLVEDEYGLALTGGGMDLSWEICAAFVALGKCPPAHFADLPRMAMQLTDAHRLTIAAMRRTLEVRAQWTQRAADNLDELAAYYSSDQSS